MTTLKLFTAFLSALTLSVITLSCSHSEPNDHLSSKMMQKVLLDVSMAEAYSVNVKDSTHRIGIKNTDSLSAFYKTIFSHYNITAGQFNTSLDWYRAHPDELDSLYYKMIPVAARWQAQNNAIPRKDTTRKTDATQQLP